MHINRNYLLHAWCVAMAIYLPAAMAADASRVDFLSFARGTVPIGIEGAAKELGIGMSQALQVIDGDGGNFVVTPKPGGANTAIVFVYELPALTTFEAFAVPNILETPSPSQTFFKTVSIAGSQTGPSGSFKELAGATLVRHSKKGATTVIPAATQAPVRWVRVTLAAC